MEQAGQYVAAEPVGAERQRRIGKRRQQRRAGDAEGIAGGNPRRKHRGSGDDRQQRDADGACRNGKQSAQKAHTEPSEAPMRGSSTA